MTPYIACHKCDLINRIQPLSQGAVLKCTRCGSTLISHKPNSLDRTLSLAIAGLILLVISNIYPLISLISEGYEQKITLFQSAMELYVQGMWGLGALVFFTCILVPFVQLSGFLYILLPLKFKRLPWMPMLVFRLLKKLYPWGMMEVFMLGILVSLVKLAEMASLIPGIALYSLVALIFVTAGVGAFLDPHIIWDRVAPKENQWMKNIRQQ